MAYGHHTGTESIRGFAMYHRKDHIDDARVETYRLYAKLPVFRRRVERSLETIRQALKAEPHSYVAWSGGKDSTALLHLVRRVEPNIPILHVRTDIEYPDCQIFVDEMIEAWQLPVTILTGPSAWEVLREEGGPFGQVNVATSRIDKECFFEPIEREVEQAGYKQVFMGLRAQESYSRRMNRVVRGARYYNKSRDIWSCNPIVDWDARDVFAYHLVNDIPMSPIYSRAYLHPEPERIREGWWTPGDAAAGHGMLVWLRYHYPQLYERLKAEWPHVAAGV